MINKIRVLHILDELNTGGAEKIVVSYFQHIDRSRFQWDFVITRYADPHKRGLLEDTVEALGGHIYRVHRKRENYRANIKDVDKIIKNGHYDIVHSHLDELSTFYLLSAKKYGVPVRICHSHLAGAKRGRAIEALCKILKPILNRAVTDRFACGYDAAVALWGKKAVSNGNVHIMHNAIDTDKYSYNEKIRNQVRQNFGLSGKTVLGTVGRMSYQKNSEFNIDIFYKYHHLDNNSILLIIGEGELENKMKQKVSEYGLEDCVLFLGRRNDVNELMMAMDLFLLPSRYEGLPIVMVEAQCSGLCCLVSDKITREVCFNNNVHYLSIKKNASDWAREALLLIKKETRRNSGKARLQEKGYDLSVEARNLQDYYIKALEKN